MATQTETFFIIASVAISTLAFIASCVLFVCTKGNLKECKKLVKKTSLLDGQPVTNNRHIAVSKQKRQEIDNALGLVSIKTKINKDIYLDTIAKVMDKFDFVEQAAIRYIIENYVASQWISVATDIPEAGCNVWGYCESTQDYLCVSITEAHEWVVVEHDDNTINMPSRLIVTHWKHFDEVVA